MPVRIAAVGANSLDRHARPQVHDNGRQQIGGELTIFWRAQKREAQDFLARFRLPRLVEAEDSKVLAAYF